MQRRGMRKDEELSEFDTLDATERTAMEGALSRCRVLVDKVVSELSERKLRISPASYRWRTFKRHWSTPLSSSNRKPTVRQKNRAAS